MAADVSELQVFIASPSDLDEERKALRKIEATLNVTFAPAGIRVRFTGWEEVPPGYGRPQAQINPLVDECDIFIGMLRRRWGTATGEHESGFIEEYERAVARRGNAGSEPEIALFFATLSKGELDDAGPDLKKVLRFKGRIEKQHSALYATFATPEDVADKVQSLLNSRLVALMVGQREPSAPLGATSGTPASGIDESSKETNETVGGADELDPARLEIIETLERFRDLVSGDKLAAPVDRDRLEMLGTALGQDNETLGTHLINRLYRRRHELSLSHIERACWFRSLLEDVGLRPEAIHRGVPGWAIIASQGEDMIELLLQFAGESNESVGRGALRTLQRLNLRPTELWPSSLRLSANADTNGDFDATTDAERTVAWTQMLNRYPGRGAALDYLLQDIDSTTTEIIDPVGTLLAQLLESKELNDSSRRLVDGASQALEGDPEALADALGYSSDDNSSWRLVLRHAAQLSPKLLNQFARQDINRRSKLAAIKAGLAAGSLSDSTLTSLLLLDGDSQIADLLIKSVTSDTNRVFQFLTLMRSSEKALKPAETEARLMAIAVPSEALKQLLATSEYSIRPWEALTYSVPDECLDEAREILRGDAAKLRSELTPKLGEEHKDLVDYLAGDQRRAAAVLLSHRQTQSENDIDLLLAWIAMEAASRFVSSTAWSILARIANDTTISKIADALKPLVADLGFRASVEHLDGPLGPAIAAMLLENDSDSNLRGEAHRWHVRQPERTNAELREALYADETAVRIAAAQSLVYRLDRTELTQLQDEYPDVRGPFWYNVVAFFDEYLYLPTPSG